MNDRLRFVKEELSDPDDPVVLKVVKSGEHGLGIQVSGRVATFLATQPEHITDIFLTELFDGIRKCFAVSVAKRRNAFSGPPH